MTGIILGLGLALAVLGWTWSQRSLTGVNQVAIAATLAAVATTYNLIVPIASVEATTTVVIVAAVVLGAPFAAAVGCAAVLATSAVGTFGTWTLWQLVGICVTALIAAGIASLMRSARRDPSWWSSAPGRWVLVAIAVLSTLAYDVITTVPTVLWLTSNAIPGTPAERVVSALLQGAAFTAVHVTASSILTALLAPSLAFALTRARVRMQPATAAG